MNQLNNTSFDRPIPGMSMTHEVGARPWQTPPTYTTVEEAAKGERPAMVEKILNNIKNTKGVDPNVSIEETMEEPQEMPMDEEPKGLMARRG